MQFDGAVRAAIDKTPGDFSPGQREIVAALFVGQSEIPAGLLPLGAVRRDAAPSDPMVREEVGEFVAQGAVNFVGAKFVEARVERDQRFSRVGRARGAAHARIPSDRHPTCQIVAGQRSQEIARGFLKRDRAIVRSRGGRGRGGPAFNFGRLQRLPDAGREFSEKVELHGINKGEESAQDSS